MTATPRRRTALALLLPAMLLGLCACARPRDEPPPSVHTRLLDYGPVSVARQDGRCFVRLDDQWFQAEGLDDYLGRFDTLTVWTSDRLAGGTGGPGNYQVGKGDSFIGAGRILPPEADGFAPTGIQVVAGVISGVRHHQRDIAGEMSLEIAKTLLRLGFQVAVELPAH